MKEKKMRSVAMALIGVGILVAVAGAGAPGEPASHLWKPIADDVYLQEVGQKIVSEKPVRSVAVFREAVYGVIDGKVFGVEDRGFKEMAGPGDVRRIVVLKDALWALRESGLSRFDGTKWESIGDVSAPMVGACLHLGNVCVATGDSVFRVDGEKLVPLEFGKGDGGILAIASHSGTLYCLYPGGLGLVDPVLAKGIDRTNTWDWGMLPSKVTRDLLAHGSRLFIATDRGLGVLQGMSLTSIRGSAGLPYEDLTCLREGFDGDVWIGSTWGAIRMTKGEYQYFAADRWLPNSHVNDISVSEHRVVIATDGGVGIVDYEPYTLAKKAAFYERHLIEWGQKRLGFTHQLNWDDAHKEWVREVSDNDVGWSSHYLAAMCFKYAVTKDEGAKREAEDAFGAMKFSEEITGIPGFPARSVWSVDEKGYQSPFETDPHTDWRRAKDTKWIWKGDTSSDETDAHFYAAPIYAELIGDANERARAVEHVGRIMTHIMDNGWVLRDVTGKPTRWARWDPEYLNSRQGSYARGLNGMEVLEYLITARALTENEKFQQGFDSLMGQHYADELLREKLTFPPDAIFHSDDRLAFYVYYSLLKYTTDPNLRSLFLRSFERSWEIERIEHNPWFNFIYGASTANDCEAEEAVTHLRDWPLDCVKYSYHNSQRTDLHTPAGYVPYSGGIRAIWPRETGPLRWSDATLELDGGNDGKVVVDPSGWLDAYWMGRYYGMIEAPKTTDAKLTTVDAASRKLGAEPYAGPARP